MSDPVLTRTPGGAQRAVARRALDVYAWLYNPRLGCPWKTRWVYAPPVGGAEAPAPSEARVRAYLTGEEEALTQAAQDTLDNFSALDLSALLAADLRRAHQALAVLLDALDARDAERDRLGVTSYLADARLAVARREARAALAAGGIS